MTSRRIPLARPSRTAFIRSTTRRGYVSIGDCFDNPRFAVESIKDWWQSVGCRQFPEAKKLTLPLFAGVLSPRITRPFYAVPRTSVAHTASD